MGRQFEGRHYSPAPQERWSWWMTVLVVVLVVGTGTAVWLVLRGGSSPSDHPSRPPVSQSSPVPPATRARALSFVQHFAAARVDGRSVDAFVTKDVRAAYRTHVGGLSLSAYSGADINGFYLFRFEALQNGRFAVGIDLNLKGRPSPVKENLVIGPGRAVDGTSGPLVVLRADKQTS